MVYVGETRSAWQLLLVAAAAATLSAVPARAEYAAHWYENGKLIVGSVKVEARGPMSFGPPSTQNGPYINCRNVVASWTLANPSTGEAGTGELTSLTASRCRGKPRCTGASASIGGVPKRASLMGKSSANESLEGMSMGAECSTGGFGGGYGYLYVQITRRSVMKLEGTFYSCDPHEYPICSYHPATASGKLALPNNITAK